MSEVEKKRVFVTGGTGFMGSRLIAALLSRGHAVRALVRKGSEGKLPPGCEVIVADPLDAFAFASRVSPCDTFVQLVGVTHPNPSKVVEFRAVDFGSARASVQAAKENGIEHFVYVSVARPAPVMKAYVNVRAECEEMIRASSLNATILRPWYVLGPGRLWPYLLMPFYWVAERIPVTRESARRLGLVTHQQMICALVGAVENPAKGFRILEVPQIRQSAS